MSPREVLLMRRPHGGLGGLHSKSRLVHSQVFYPGILGLLRYKGSPPTPGFPGGGGARSPPGGTHGLDPGRACGKAYCVKSLRSSWGGCIPRGILLHGDASATG